VKEGMKNKDKIYIKEDDKENKEEERHEGVK
jgi:hypothetical protein